MGSSVCPNLRRQQNAERFRGRYVSRRVNSSVTGHCRWSGFGEQMVASRGVAIARLTYTGANTILEMLLSSHDDVTFQWS